MNKPLSFYNAQLKEQQLIVKNAKQKLTQLSIARFLVFIITVLGVYFTFNQYKTATGIAVIGLALFLFLLKKYAAVKAVKKIAAALVVINEDEIKIKNGDFHSREEGLVFQNPTHFYSLDIDLFGKGSFYQFINRTQIKEGAQKLANCLTDNDILDIPERQAAIQELATLPKWRQHFQAIAGLVQIETPAHTIIDWLKKYDSLLPQIMKRLPLFFSIVSGVIITLAFTSVIPDFVPVIWMLIGLMITGKHLSKISNLSTKTDNIKSTFRQYSVLLETIESQNFSSVILNKKQQQITQNNKKASIIFNEFSKLLNALDSRNNMIFAIIGNGFLLWDCKQSYLIEQWIATYKHKVEDWFEVISFFDAYNSLGNFAFNHPSYVFPEIVNTKTAIKTESLGHPLLKTEKRIDNNFEIDQQQFFIITGANMAGKSTFLRTVSLHIVMANVGLPVCATQSNYYPVKLITSMRTSDSLTDDSSYFFSELTRLKFIVDTIQKDNYFIILDEILKGTNSTDKAIGSRKFVEKLVASKATGIIATHDLSLCKIEQQLPAVKNYYFDAEIRNDELFFDYTFKKGICQNMNASFLLRKMEII